MTLSSDVTLSTAKFGPSAISQSTHDFDEKLIAVGKSGPQWFEVGAEKYRQMRWNGETPLPKPRVIESGIDTVIPSRDKGRDIPVRIFRPASGQTQGVMMHIHGGGWVLQSEKYQDPLLEFLANSADLTVVSVGYRLAPENPFPAGPNDCFDAAEWLVDNSTQEYGAALQFLGGESAGGHLSALTCFQLIHTRPHHVWKGVLFNYAAFDLAGFTPSCNLFDQDLVLTGEIMRNYIKVFLPNTTFEQRRDPSISPLYADLRSLAASSVHRALPPAFFCCGTSDPLLDDTVFMSARWQMSGAEAVVRIYPGAPHGVNMYDPEQLEGAKQSLDDTKQFLQSKVGRARGLSLKQAIIGGS